MNSYPISLFSKAYHSPLLMERGKGVRLLFLPLILSLLSIAVSAQTPDIRIKTSIYETSGATNSFTLVLGAAPGKTGFADIKCSGGNQSEAELITAYYDEETQALVGTNVSCQVDQQGIVEVFCDEGVVIDYISCTGAYITGIEVKNPEAVEILALEHNSLESLDLSAFTGLTALYLNDNPFNKKPLIVGPDKPKLQILELSIIDNIDISFDINTYPELRSFVAYSTPTLVHINPTGCPKLLQLSLDNTNISGLDLRNNPELRILNVSETRVQNIDLSVCPKLEQFYATHRSSYNTDCKLDKIDVSHCPNLIYLAVSGNNLTSIDISKNTKLRDIYLNQNHLTQLDLSKNTDLINVYIDHNDMDFTSLPLPQDTWGDFNLQQRDLRVPTAVLEGSPIDLSGRLVRQDGSETYATVFMTNPENPDIDEELDPSLYSFEKGVLTIHQAMKDSLYASFYNTAFQNTTLSTSRFVVKDESSFDKPNLMATLKNNLPVGAEIRLSVGLMNAKVGGQRKFLIDLGDGNLKSYFAGSPSLPAEPNVIAQKNGTGDVRVLMPEGEILTALKIEDIALSALDITKAEQLSQLVLRNTRLKTLDLQWNRLLETIEITGNDFGADFTLAGANGGYGKNLLYHIDLRDNNMTAVKLNEPYSWQYIDLSGNHLTDLNFTNADNVQFLDVSHNDFEYLKINYLGKLTTFYCNDNKLSELILPETNVIEHFNCANNCFTFANIPQHICACGKNAATCPTHSALFTYAPQADIQIPSKGAGYNLNSQNVILDGKSTVFTWKTTDGQTLSEGTDYTCTDGVTHFNSGTIGKSLYCELTNAAYPAFSGANALKTSAMLSAGMPTHLLATFTTPKGGQTARLALTSAVPNNSVYIDWTGTDSFEQYPLATSYTVFSPTTTAGAKVKVWSYEENDNLTVFSISGITLADVDLSPMKNLTCLTLSEAGISSLIMPESPNLQELSLNGGAFTSFDFKKYPNLIFLNFDNNKFTTLDLSGLDRLQSVGFSANGLTSVTLSGNKSLWQLALANNKLESIDLSGAPNLEQVFLNGNKLTDVSLDGLKSLRVIYLDNNKFDFSNLPVPNAQWYLYTYGNQPELKCTPQEGVVDLSRQAERDGVKTVYNWFYGLPTIDPVEGTISGEPLIENDEYIIKDGVTTFRADIDKVCCVLTNELFPQTYLITNVFAVTANPAAISDATADASALALRADGRTVTISGVAAGSEVLLLTADGKVAAKTAADAAGKACLTAPASGLYIVSANGAAKKIAVK